MDQYDDDVIYQCKFFQIHNDGRVKVHHARRDKPSPPADNPFNIRFKDVVICEGDNITARIFLPEPRPGMKDSKKKLPTILYIHGGGFCMLSPYAAPFHHFCSKVAAKASAIVISVDYGLFPDRPIPACYEDSWAALKWVGSHSTSAGPDPWINSHADLNNLFLAGDSAGANIAHTLAIRVGSVDLAIGVKLAGMVMLHPFFGGTEDDIIWLKMYPTNQGINDPKLNPTETDLAGLGCEKVLIFVAEDDHLCESGRRYYEKLSRSGWKGKVEIHMNLGQGHVFHLRNPEHEQATDMVAKVAEFVNADSTL